MKHPLLENDMKIIDEIVDRYGDEAVIEAIAIRDIECCGEDYAMRSMLVAAGALGSIIYKNRQKEAEKRKGEEND